MKDKKRFEGVLPHSVLNIFEYIETAGSIIDDAKAEWPDRAYVIDALFEFVVPGDLLRSASIKLYRTHVTELVLRAVNGHDLRPGTNAEVCAALSASSLQAPLSRDWAAAYGKVFGELFPEHKNLSDGLTESYQGAADEVIRELRAKCGRLAGRPKDLR